MYYGCVDGHNIFGWECKSVSVAVSAYRARCLCETYMYVCMSVRVGVFIGMMSTKSVTVSFCINLSISVCLCESCLWKLWGIFRSFSICTFKKSRKDFCSDPHLAWNLEISLTGSCFAALISSYQSSSDHAERHAEVFSATLKERSGLEKELKRDEILVPLFKWVKAPIQVAYGGQDGSEGNLCLPSFILHLSPSSLMTRHTVKELEVYVRGRRKRGVRSLNDWIVINWFILAHVVVFHCVN